MKTENETTSPELGITPAQLSAISVLMNSAQASQTYIYPWDTLEADLERRGSDQLVVLGYGSLVNRSSAGHTLSDTAGKPAVAFGVRRLFNYVIPDTNRRYGAPPDSTPRAALNVVATSRRSDVVNGVLLEVPLREIGAFRSREVGYDLVPVACIDWYDRNAPPFLVHILHCPDEPRDGRVRTAPGMEPHPEYYRVCRDGAAEIDPSFLKLWLATTFLADLSTTAGEWEEHARNREG